MSKKNQFLVSLIFLAIISQIITCSATENITLTANPIKSFLDQTTNNPVWNIIGINETANFKEIILTVILIIVAILTIYGLIDFTDLIPEKLVGLIIATIIVLAGSYKGFTFNIAKKLIETPKSLLELLKTPIFWIIMGIIILLIVFTPWIKKAIKKEKEAVQEEKLEKKRRKREMREKIKEYETDLDLKRYGIDPEKV